MNEEFPGVVDLNVCGTHYRTLLATLTKDEDSKLAAMFTGQSPVYKDTDGRYFIEADGVSFKTILHYLQYEELPFQEANNNASFAFGGGGGFGAGPRAGGLFGDRSHGFTARQIEMLYKDALNLGLTKLSRHLEQFQSTFVNMKMDEYRKSIRGYDSCIAEILSIIPAESLFHKTDFTLRIKQDLQTIAEEKCCEHDCKMMPWNSFGHLCYASIDAIVKVPFEINPTVLSAFAIDLQKRGYLVQGRMTVCDFNCKKDLEIKQSKYIVFAGQAKKCCVEELFLLTFKWDTEANVVTHPGAFGMKQTFGQKQTTGGLFGANQNTGFQFGSKQPNPADVFGSAQQGSFGQDQTFGFGSSKQQGGFGQGSGDFSFGSAQQGQGSFGQGQIVGFGSSKQQGGFGQGSGGFSFGGAQQGQGSSGQAPQSAFGSAQQQGTFGQGSGSFSFGGTQQGNIGPSQASGFGSASTQGSSFSFGGGPQQSLFGKTSQQNASIAAPSPQQQDSSLFGATVVMSGQQTGQPQGSGLFGSSSFKQQQTAPVVPVKQPLFGGGSSVLSGNQNLPFGSTQTGPQNSSGTSFSFRSPPKQQTAFAGKGPKSGSQQSGQQLFGGPPNKMQHIFGGTPSFENKFSGLSLQQPTEKPDQSVSNVTTSNDDTSSTLFGKPAVKAGSNAQQLELDNELLEKDQ